MGTYGATLVATNSMTKTVHILATVTVEGRVSQERRTACGLTVYRKANAMQIAVGARCATCTGAHNEHPARWERSGMAAVCDWASRLTDRQLKSLPRRERSWFTSLRAGGFVPAYDADAAYRAHLDAIGAWSGTRRAGQDGDKVTVLAQVTRVREVPDSVRGKNGKPRPMLRVVEVEGAGADAGVRWQTTTRAVSVGTLVPGDMVRVTATVRNVLFWEGGLGDTVVNPLFTAA